MLLPILLACTPSEPADSLVVADSSQVLDAIGDTLLAGMDLDHDGIAEWAGARYIDEYGPSSVHVYQGTEERLVREEDDFYEYFGLLDVADMDEDGYDDLLWRACEGGDCRLRIATSDAREDDAVMALAGDDDRFAGTPWSIDVLPDTQEVLGAWNVGGWAITLAVPPMEPSTNELPNVVAATDVALVDCRDEACSDDYIEFTDVALIAEAAGPPTHYLTGRSQRSDHGHSGWICPLEELEKPAVDCELLDADVDIGWVNVAADLDGDGISELISLQHPTRDEPGSVWIYERDGSWRATLRGSGEAQLWAAEVITDDHGDTWLLTMEHGARVFAFRTEALVGDLTLDDADRQYVHGSWGGAGVESMATYRETEDGPLWLLLGLRDSVTRMPFEPEG